MTAKHKSFRTLEYLKPFIEQIERDKELWTLFLDREKERKQFEEIAKSTGKRADLEPEYFPEPTRPTEVEAVYKYLNVIHGIDDQSMAAQIAIEVSAKAYSFI